MTITIKKKLTTKQIAAARKLLGKKDKKKSGLMSFYGALKRGLDGIAYQKEVRNEWH